MKKLIIAFAVLLAITISLPAFAVDLQPLAPPTLAYVSSTHYTITLRVTGGAATGAPAGFTLQWMPITAGFSGTWPTTGLHQATYVVSTITDASKPFQLAAGQAVIVVIGAPDLRPTLAYWPVNDADDPLQLATGYVFRAFANAYVGYALQSGYTSLFYAPTLPAPVVPVPPTTPEPGPANERHGKGFWKHNLGIAGSANSALAATTFFRSGLTWAEILHTPPKGGDTYYKLAQQYITALLNAQDGVPVPAEVQAALGSAGQYLAIAGPGVRANTPQGKANLRLASILASWHVPGAPAGR